MGEQLSIYDAIDQPRQLRREIPQAHARHNDPDTSKAAARSLGDLRDSQVLVLHYLRRYGPMSDEALLAQMLASGDHISPSGARTRRRELADLGLVRDTGKTVRLASGRKAIVWAAK